MKLIYLMTMRRIKHLNTNSDNDYKNIWIFLILVLNWIEDYIW